MLIECILYSIALSPRYNEQIISLRTNSCNQRPKGVMRYHTIEYYVVPMLQDKRYRTLSEWIIVALQVKQSYLKWFEFRLCFVIIACNRRNS